MKIHINKAVIADANILIDYMEVGRKVLTLFASSIDSLYVPLAVLKEVPALSFDEADRIGIILLDTEISILSEASTIKTGCSFEDNICFLTAKKENFICATNDRNLRMICESDGVDVFWGLQIMIYLVQIKKLSKKEAVDIAKKISNINSTITKSIVDEFERLVNL